MTAPLRKLLLCSLLVMAGWAQGADENKRRAEAIRLVHHSELTKGFRQGIQGMLDVLKQENPTIPLHAWDALERVISVEPFRQFAVRTYAEAFTLEELQTINAVVCDPTKYTVMKAIAAYPPGLTNAQVLAKTEDLRKQHGREPVDAVVALCISPLTSRLSTLTDRITKEERSYAVAAYEEATKRARD